MFNTSQTLIIVYKNEMLLNQLKKLIESKDDNNDKITGTKDGTIKVVAWPQKTWLDQKKAGNITSKVIFIGDVKGVDNLIPVLDLRFDKFGAKYGWAGNQAVLFSDISVVGDEYKYNEFLTVLNKLPIPNVLKGNKKRHLEIKRNFLLNKLAKGFEGVFDDKATIHEQILIYSIFMFYYKGLKDFIES